LVAAETTSFDRREHPQGSSFGGADEPTGGTIREVRFGHLRLTLLETFAVEGHLAGTAPTGPPSADTLT
jgi:hypothetical protein